MRRQILIIVNPAAGRARSAERRLRRFVAAIENQGCTVVLRRAGSSLGDVERLAREAEPGFEAIVAAGGDGTVNAVVNGLAGRPTPLAVLPLGSANVLAREIGLPRDPEQLAKVITRAPATQLWPGRIGGRFFVMMASAGFDAEVVAAVSPAVKRRFGRIAFVWAFLVRLRHYRRCELILQFEGVEHRAAGMIAAKGRHYAGPFVVAPGADLARPELELLLFGRGGRRGILRAAIALIAGRIPRLRDVTVVRARRATVTGNRPLAVQADGEFVGELPTTIAVADEPVFLIRPAPGAQC